MGIVTTGSEVQKGLITDTFTPVLRDKFAKFPSEVIGQTKPGDDMEQITADILKFIEEGADMVVCSGGMSVDPDDRTPGAIKSNRNPHRILRCTRTSGSYDAGFLL